MRAEAIALARVVERRIRTSKTIATVARRAVATLARVSSEVRAFVRLRLMPLV